MMLVLLSERVIAMFHLCWRAEFALKAIIHFLSLYPTIHSMHDR